RDDRAAAIDWLDRLGNPYVSSGFDPEGKAAVDWGVTGAPETFLIDSDGTILHKRISPRSAVDEGPRLAVGRVARARGRRFRGERAGGIRRRDRRRALSRVDPGDSLPEVPQREHRGVECAGGGRPATRGAETHRRGRIRRRDQDILVGALWRVRAVQAAHDAHDVRRLGRTVLAVGGGRIRLLANARREGPTAARRGAPAVTQTFWTVAALFFGVAFLILFVPVWRHKKRGGRWSIPGIVAAVLIAPLAAVLYGYVSNWDAEIAERTSQENAVLDQLAQQLERTPNDLQGWTLLAASYMQVGRYEEGRAAYQRVWALTRAPDDELKIAYAESQILADRATLTGEAGRLIEEVLQSRPNDPKALWYGGHVALELGRDDDVRARWSRLLTMNIPEEVARVVQT